MKQTVSISAPDINVASKSSAIQLWLNRKNQFFSSVLEEGVSNRQVLLLGHASFVFSALICASFVSQVPALICLAWFILMTALTMIFGLFPLMVASGVGANGNSSLGTGTVGGMVIGTLALLFIVPSLFIVFQYLQEKVRPIQFQPAADWQIQEECVEAKEERQHHIESKNEEKK